MSNHLALATVTATLQSFLQSWLNREFEGITVTTERPGSPESSHRPSDWRVNVYLYQVRPNASLRNEELAVRRADGSFVQRPAFALDLHYLVSFYGDETALQPQRAMGSTLTALHTWPVLDRALIAAAIGDYEELAGSDLDRQPAAVRLTPQQMELEDLSRIWSVLLQTPYVPTVPYVASVVMLEPELSVGRALPVSGRAATIGPRGRPRIVRVEKVVTSADASEGIHAQSRIRIHGSELGAPHLEVFVGGVRALPAANGVRETSVELDLARVAGLRAGLQPLWVVQPGGDGAVDGESEATALALRPRVQDVSVASQETHAGGLVSATLRVAVDVAVAPEQRVMLSLNLLPGSPGAPHSAGVRAAPRDSSSDPLEFVLRRVPAGTWLVRVMIDGAESELARGPAAPGEVLGRYASPTVTLGVGP